MPVQFKIDVNNAGTVFPHYWEVCVGSCHAYTGLREDWRKLLKKCHEELGFRYVRFHGLLNDDMSVCTRVWSWGKETDEVRYSFFNIDSIFDFLLEIGMKPFIELGFMPEVLASGTKTCFHYKGNITPPADYKEWEKLIRMLTRHLVDRYGVEEVRTWFFEVWNEPNLRGFWAGTKEEYLRLYKHSAEAIKSVDKQLPVGGPATSINSWIPDIIEFCRKTGTPLDFVSTHHYPTDDPMWKDDKLTIEEFFAKFAELGKYERGIMYKMTVKARAQAGSLPLYYTEWNASAKVPDDIHDECYQAAFVAKTIADNSGLVDGYSFWTFSDLFEEAGQLPSPFHGGFGLLTIHGIPKPTYRVFELLHGMGTRRLSVEGGQSSTVEVLAVAGEKDITLLAYNHNIPGAPISEEDIRIRLQGAGSYRHAVITRIDENSANPKKKWIELGRPEYPSRQELELIYQASLPQRSNLSLKQEKGECVVAFRIPPHGVAAIVLSR